jgi:hypothetical protein
MASDLKKQRSSPGEKVVQELLGTDDSVWQSLGQQRKHEPCIVCYTLSLEPQSSGHDRRPRGLSTDCATPVPHPQNHEHSMILMAFVKFEGSFLAIITETQHVLFKKVQVLILRQARSRKSLGLM